MENNPWTHSEGYRVWNSHIVRSEKTFHWLHYLWIYSSLKYYLSDWSAQKLDNLWSLFLIKYLSFKNLIGPLLYIKSLPIFTSKFVLWNNNSNTKKEFWNETWSPFFLLSRMTICWSILFVITFWIIIFFYFPICFLFFTINKSIWISRKIAAIRYIRQGWIPSMFLMVKWQLVQCKHMSSSSTYQPLPPSHPCLTDEQLTHCRGQEINTRTKKKKFKVTATVIFTLKQLFCRKKK